MVPQEQCMCFLFFLILLFSPHPALFPTVNYKALYHSLSLSSHLSTRQRDKAIFWVKLSLRVAATNNVPLYLGYSCNGN